MLTNKKGLTTEGVRRSLSNIGIADGGSSFSSKATERTQGRKKLREGLLSGMRFGLHWQRGGCGPRISPWPLRELPLGALKSQRDSLHVVHQPVSHRKLPAGHHAIGARRKVLEPQRQAPTPRSVPPVPSADKA